MGIYTHVNLLFIPFIYCLLNQASAIPGHWFFRIKQRNGLTSSVSACHVNSTDGLEIKGPSRQPFFHTLTILGDKLIPINLIKDMWETQPYVEEISVELDLFSIFSLQITGVSDTAWTGAWCTHIHTQSISTFTIVFFETLKGDNKILINPEHSTGPFGFQNTFQCTQTHIYWYVPYYIAPHLACFPCTALCGWHGLVAQLTLRYPHYPQMPIKKNPIYWRLLKYRNGKLSLDTKRQKTSKRTRREGEHQKVRRVERKKESKRRQRERERCTDWAMDSLKMRQKGGNWEVDYGCSDLISIADIMMVSFLFIFLAQLKHSRQIGF